MSSPHAFTGGDLESGHKFLCTMQILMTTACQLVSSKRVVAGTLRMTPSQLHFTGEVKDEEGSCSPRVRTAACNRLQQRVQCCNGLGAWGPA